VASTEINVNKLPVKDYLETGQKYPLLIPDYQRPYSWGEDEVRTLWDDVVNAFSGNAENDYFCGAIVTFRNDDNWNEIIDGQQRTTTLLLMLRAIYRTLEKSGREDVAGLKSAIEACLWARDRKSGISDRDKILIDSRVASDEASIVLLNILKSGEFVEGARDSYTTNYRLLSQLIDKQVQDNPADWADLCDYILHKVILLPIECDNQDTALTIFSTLNNRGLPLSDADIFKAKIFNHLPKADRTAFIDDWKELESETEASGIDIQTLFYYYMFYLRAVDGDTSASTPGLRRYYSQRNFESLFASDLMDHLSKLSDLWKIVNNREELDEYPFSKVLSIQKTFDILKQYTNEWWKYLVSIYFLVHHAEPDFPEMFDALLHELAAYIIAKFAINPTLHSIKSDFLYMNRDVVHGNTFDFRTDFSLPRRKAELRDALTNRIRMYHRATRPLLYVHAYANPNQTSLLPQSIEVEHILPRKWTNTNLFGFNRKEVEEQIESLGNKTILEKKTNIQAGNRSFFAKKNRYYLNSLSADARDLAEIKKDDWTPNDIVRRNDEVADTILSQFEKWGLFDSRKIDHAPTSLVRFTSNSAGTVTDITSESSRSEDSEIADLIASLRDTGELDPDDLFFVSQLEKPANNQTKQ